MRAWIGSILGAFALSAISMSAHAHTAYVGYSGAPGSGGTCAASCHGSSSGTVHVCGFPTEYVAGQTYPVTVYHSGGSMIKQFNGSCRVGTGSLNAGVIAAGTGTVTYNTAGETNGVHLTTIDVMSGTFLWTAPSAGTGVVTLYVAGHQGSISGANTTVVLTASEQSAGVLSSGLPATGYLLMENYPNPFRARTVFDFVLPRADAVFFDIYDLSGRRLQTYSGDRAAGFNQFTWDASAYPAGVYFCRMRSGEFSDTQRMLLSR
jgi:hypothetical protein